MRKSEGINPSTSEINSDATSNEAKPYTKL